MLFTWHLIFQIIIWGCGNVDIIDLCFPQDNYLIFLIIMIITDQCFIIVIFKQVVSCPAGFTNCTLSTFKHTRTQCRLMTVGRRGARKKRVLSRRKPEGLEVGGEGEGCCLPGTGSYRSSGTFTTQFVGVTWCSFFKGCLTVSGRVCIFIPTTFWH